MERFSRSFKPLLVVVSLYVMTVSFAAVYFNWQFARQNGFARWLMFGEVVSTLKATVWPYFALRRNTLPARNEIKPLTSAQIASLELKNMIDALNASQQATFLINAGRGLEGAGIRSYDNIDRIVAYRKTAQEHGRKTNIEVLNSIYPELGARFRDDFLTFIDMFLEAYESNSDEILKQADGRNDRWSDWYQANQKAIQAASDKALGY
jgi:hypothetical protein